VLSAWHDGVGVHVPLIESTGMPVPVAIWAQGVLGDMPNCAQYPAACSSYEQHQTSQAWVVLVAVIIIAAVLVVAAVLTIVMVRRDRRRRLAPPPPPPPPLHPPFPSQP
jgi:heme/copper-type cytochrome/quinol oxidase subunit 2